MFRYFIAVRPPQEQSVHIANVMSMLGDPWPVPHVTVKDPDGLTPDLMWLSRVREVAAQSARFNLKVGLPRTFGNRVLYLSVEGTGLERLHHDIEAIFSRRAGFKADSSGERAFTPHLTLSVAHEGHELPPIGAWASSLRGLGPFEVSELTVFRRDVPSTHYQAWTTLPLWSRQT